MRTKISIKSSSISILFFSLMTILLSSLGVFLHPESTQWDFHFYYAAQEAFRQGVNPYLPGNMAQFWHGNTAFRYGYPPLTLYVFSVLGIFSQSAAFGVWLGLKVSGATCLLWLWKRYLFEETSLVFFLLYSVLVFNFSFYADIRAGNISVYEQVFLWLGIIFLLKGRDTLFVVGVFLAACLKGILLPFLALPFFIGHPQWKRILMFGLGLSLLWVLLNWVSYGHWFGDYLQGIGDLKEIDMNIGPSTLTLLNTLSSTPTVVYSLWVVFILGLLLYLRLISKPKFSTHMHISPLTCLWITMFIFSYALTVPRLKDYALILLIPAPLLLWIFHGQEQTSSIKKWGLLFLMSLSVTQGYGIWLAMFGFWLFTCTEIYRISKP